MGLPPLMMLAMVVFIAICVTVENAAMDRRKIRMRRADEDRRAAVGRAERAHLAEVAGHLADVAGAIAAKGSGAKASGAAQSGTAGDATPGAALQSTFAAPRRGRRVPHPPNSPAATVGVTVIMVGVVCTYFGWIAGLSVLGLSAVSVFSVHNVTKK